MKFVWLLIKRSPCSLDLMSSHSIRVLCIPSAGDIKIALIRGRQEVDEVLPDQNFQSSGLTSGWAGQKIAE